MDEQDIFEGPNSKCIWWLSRHGPGDWHRSALTYNWDNSLKPLMWIVSQAECDRGTAITLYHRGQPEFFARYETLSKLEAECAHEMEAVELLMSIANRWAARGYTEYGFKPDLSFAKIDLNARPPWPVSANLADPAIQGEDLSLSGFAEGLPVDFLDELQMRDFG
jgi:Domain of unknown function (DUF4274)